MRDLLPYRAVAQPRLYSCGYCGVWSLVHKRHDLVQLPYPCLPDPDDMNKNWLLEARDQVSPGGRLRVVAERYSVVAERYRRGHMPLTYSSPVWIPVHRHTYEVASCWLCTHMGWAVTREIKHSLIGPLLAADRIGGADGMVDLVAAATGLQSATQTADGQGNVQTGTTRVLEAALWVPRWQLAHQHEAYSVSPQTP